MCVSNDDNYSNHHKHYDHSFLDDDVMEEPAKPNSPMVRDDEKIHEAIDEGKQVEDDLEDLDKMLEDMGKICYGGLCGDY